MQLLPAAAAALVGPRGQPAAGLSNALRPSLSWPTWEPPASEPAVSENTSLSSFLAGSGSENENESE